MKRLLALGLSATMALLMCTPAYAVNKDDVNDAVEKGVKALRAMQQANGTWPHTQIGATALAALALLECGVKEDDKDMMRAADAVRGASLTMTQTYSLSLAILFFDRLGDPDDVPLIESLMVRLLAGQDKTSGGWSYECPAISAAEVNRLKTKLDNRKESADRRELAKPKGKPTAKDLSPEIRAQLEAVERGGAAAAFPGGVPGAGFAPPPFPMMGGGDNSNTQFASLALWVGRRHGLPVERALERLNRRFRTTQNEDGGWSYMSTFPPIGARVPPMRPFDNATASMTCAGLLGLAIADGATLERLRERKRDAKIPDISEDKNLKNGLQLLASVIDNPKGLTPKRPEVQHPFGPPVRVGGRTYYFLWSLERVAVALDLDTIGKKDWYSWGAEILLENQDPNGSWSGDHANCGADTCFALMFLKRANLVRDLTKQLKGMVKDPGERTLRGGIGLNNVRGNKKMRSGIESLEAKPIDKPAPKPADGESGRLAGVLLKATGARRPILLEEMENGKGTHYTEALATAIPKLEGEAHHKAREALANRLTRMKDETLADYLQDDDAEIRRAAALAVGQKESKALTPHLIALLRDTETSVVRAAHASLKALTGKDFGPAAKATRDERDRAILRWTAWWSKQRKK